MTNGTPSGPVLADANNTPPFSIEDYSPPHPGIAKPIVLATLFFIGALIAAYETRDCIKLLGRIYVIPNLTRHIDASKQYRSKAKADSATPNSTESWVAVHQVLFNQTEQGVITRATQELLSNPTVRDSFPKYDKIPLDKTDAIVVPLLRMPVSADRNQMGVTPAGYISLKEQIDLDPEGITFREMPIEQKIVSTLGLDAPDYPKTLNGMPRITKDGTPRIALNSKVINQETFEKLKLTLLHEFVHAHDIPGYTPYFSKAHNDLTYLPGYNAMIDKLNLDPEDSRKEWELRVSIGLFLTVTITQIRQAIKWRSRRACTPPPKPRAG